MCVICYKPVGEVLPTTQAFYTMIHNNPDGAGYMLALGDTVLIKKGFISPKKLLKSIRDSLSYYNVDEKDISIVIHARIATSGLVKPENCHPFPLSSQVSDLQALQFNCDTGVAHNGNLGNTKGNLSDTQVFIKDILSKFTFKDLLKSPTHELLLKTFSYDRLLVLHKDSRVFKSGIWKKDRGLFWSNDSYTYVQAYKRNNTKVCTYRNGVKIIKNQNTQGQAFGSYEHEDDDFNLEEKDDPLAYFANKIKDVCDHCNKLTYVKWCYTLNGFYCNTCLHDNYNLIKKEKSL